MRVRQLARFEADFPLDWTTDEDGETVPGLGKPAAEEIVKILKSLGFTVDGDVDLEEEHGWQFRFLYEGVDIFGQTTYLEDDYTLSFKCFSSRFWIFPPSRATWNKFGQALVRIDSALRSDGRFENLRWFGMNEHLSNPAGSSSPVCGVY